MNILKGGDQRRIGLLIQRLLFDLYEDRAHDFVQIRQLPLRDFEEVHGQFGPSQRRIPLQHNYIREPFRILYIQPFCPVFPEQFINVGHASNFAQRHPKTSNNSGGVMRRLWEVGQVRARVDHQLIEEIGYRRNPFNVEMTGVRYGNVLKAFF